MKKKEQKRIEAFMKEYKALTIKHGLHLVASLYKSTNALIAHMNVENTPKSEPQVKSE